MSFLCVILAAVLGIIPSGKAFLEPLQKRDSILIADQVKYGFRLAPVEPGSVMSLPDFKPVSNDTLVLVRGWELDTLSKKGKPLEIEASVVLAPFEEGRYRLPDLPVQISRDGRTDTLLFEAVELEVKSMPVDTATFVVKELKPLRTYPLTFAEVVPWACGGIVLAALIALAVYLMGRRRRKAAEALHRDPPYIVALRKLDKYRGDKFWKPEKQKAFYSGITDILKEYIDARFGIDAPEMTTAELFAALKNTKEFSPEMYSDLKELFERADFVKFAKMTVSDEENAGALPLAVRFVSETHQKEMEEENGNVL